MNNLQCLIVLWVFLVQQVAWGKEYPISDQGTVSATISDKGGNTIIVENDRIDHFIANENEFVFEKDSDLGQITISPQLKAGKHIYMTLVTEQKRRIPAKLTVKSEEPQTLFLIPPKYKQAKSDAAYSLQENIFHSDSTDAKQSTLELLKRMRANEAKGTKITKLSCISAYPNLVLEDGLLYTLEGKTALKAAVRNKSNQTISLDEKSFQQCLGKVSAVALDTLVLPAKSVTYVYVVGKDE
jgi:hypothetical protein